MSFLLFFVELSWAGDFDFTYFADGHFLKLRSFYAYIFFGENGVGIESLPTTSFWNWKTG